MSTAHRTRWLCHGHLERGQIADALLQLLSNLEFARDMGLRLQTRVERYYTTPRSRQRYRDLYGFASVGGRLPDGSIGFEIRKLSAPARHAGASGLAWSCDGDRGSPLILTVIALSIIQSRVTFETECAQHFIQALIIYGFALSLIATAPVTAVAVRAASDEIYLKRFHSPGADLSPRNARQHERSALAGPRRVWHDE